jgi:hypothetical protein
VEVALRIKGITRRQVGPIRCKEDRFASRVFFLEDGWVLSKERIAGIISNHIWKEAELPAQCVYTKN